MTNCIQNHILTILKKKVFERNPAAKVLLCIMTHQPAHHALICVVLGLCYTNVYNVFCFNYSVLLQSFNYICGKST